MHDLTEGLCQAFHLKGKLSVVEVGAGVDINGRLAGSHFVQDFGIAVPAVVFGFGIDNRVVGGVVDGGIQKTFSLVEFFHRSSQDITGRSEAQRILEVTLGVFLPEVRALQVGKNCFSGFVSLRPAFGFNRVPEVRRYVAV